MALEIKSKCCATDLGEQDGSVLEGPTDVVAIAMDHEDESTRGGVEREP